MTLQDPERWTRAMTVLGRVIVVSAVVATMSLLVLVQRLSTTGLSVTEDSAALVADSIGPVQVLSDDLADLAVAVADSLELAQDQVATTQQIVGAVGEASATNLADTAEAAADVSDRLAGLLEQVERLIPAVVATDIVELGPSFAALEATALDLQERAAAASNRIGLDLWLIRILIVAGGALFVMIGVISQRFARALAFAADSPRSDPTALPTVDR